MIAVGFRVKSGFAIAVTLEGPASAPSAVSRRVIEMSDSAVPETRQPYHDGFYHTEEDAREIARRVKIVKRCATQSIAALLKDTGATRAGLIVGSLIEPEKVGNPHIRAHASEGRLFRTVLEDALTSRGVRCEIIVEKKLPARSAEGLRRPAREIARTLDGFGKILGTPWRADEKAAATAAWLSLTLRGLAGFSRPSRGRATPVYTASSRLWPGALNVSALSVVL
jgi:hypothetical protein